MSKLLVAVAVGLAAFAVMVLGMMTLESAPTGAADAPPSPRTLPPGPDDDEPSATTTTTRAPASTSGGSGAAVTVESVDVAWAPGPALAVQLSLRNTGDEAAAATSATWALRLQGEKVAQGRASLDAAIPPGASMVTFEVPFDGDLAADWWEAYADDKEKAAAAIDGTLAVAAGSRDLAIPYEWERAWTGTLAAQVAQAADCDTSTAEVCVDSATASWSGGDLEVRLRLRNRADDSVRVRGEAALSFAGAPVATGEVDRTFIASGGTAGAEVRLAFSADAIASWWSGHVAGCEASPLRLDLALSDADGALDPWFLPLPDFHTRLACGGSA